MLWLLSIILIQCMLPLSGYNASESDHKIVQQPSLNNKFKNVAKEDQLSLNRGVFKALPLSQDSLEATGSFDLKSDNQKLPLEFSREILQIDHEDNKTPSGIYYPRLSVAYTVDSETKFILIFITALLLVLVISTTLKMCENMLQIGLARHVNKEESF